MQKYFELNPPQGQLLTHNSTTKPAANVEAPEAPDPLAE